MNKTVEQHQPVLFEPAMTGLNIQTDGIYIDGTFGRGGHSLGILERLGPQGQLMAIDKDPRAVPIEKKESTFQHPGFSITHNSFSHLEQIVTQRGWNGKVNGVLLDLGVSSPQLNHPNYGFSFQQDGPLDMRMDTTQSLNATSWINKADEKEIQQVIRNYGEERYAKRIANAIVKTRQHIPITRTMQLSNIIIDACPRREPHKHPATRTFQAIRIFINNEIEELSQCLPQCTNILKLHGRLCVISFHSLEDRVVKQFIHKESKADPFPRHFPITTLKITHRLKKIGQSITPSESEIKQNPRARSARLRIAEKIA